MQEKLNLPGTAIVKNQEQINEKSRRRYHAQNGISKVKELYKTNKKRLQEKTQNFYKNLPEKKNRTWNMEEINTEICL